MKHLFIQIMLTFSLVLPVVAQTDSVNLTPRRVVIAMERTEATRWLAGPMRAFIHEVLDQLPSGTEVAAYEFNTEVSLLAHTQSLTLEQGRAIKQRIPVSGSKTASTNFDVLLKELEHWSMKPVLVILLTRAISDPSKNHSFVELLPLLQDEFPSHAGHSIFLVGLSDKAEENYRHLANQEGMWFHRLDSKTNQPVVFLDRFLYATRNAAITPAWTKTATPVPVVSPTPTPQPPKPTCTFTITPTSTFTATPLPTLTMKPSPTASDTPTLTSTPLPTVTVTATSTATPTMIPVLLAPIATKGIPTPTPTLTPAPIVAPSSPWRESLAMNWKRLLALLTVLAVLGLASAWYHKSIQAVAAEMLDDDPDAQGVRVVTLNATNNDGRELLNQNIVVEKDPIHLTIGPHPSATVYLPEVSRTVRIRIQPDGSVLLRNGFTWREIGHGEPIDLGGVPLMTTLDIQDEEEIDHAN